MTSFRIVESKRFDDIACTSVLTCPSNQIISNDPDPDFPYRKIDQQGSLSFNVLDNLMYFSDGTEWVELASGPACNHITLNGNTGSATSVSCQLNVKTGTTTSPVATFTGAGSTLTFNLLSGSTHGDYLVWNGTTWILISADPNQNTYAGVNTLASVTSASANTVFGYNAASALTIGTQNVAIGWNALKSTTGDVRVVAIGYRALENLSTGSDSGNIAVGAFAGVSLISGTGNTAVGWGAFQNTTLDGWSTAIGYQALAATSSGNASAGNTAVGYYAGRQMSGVQNICIGPLALSNGSTDSQCIAIGYNALGLLDSGGGVPVMSANTVIGYSSASKLSTGTSNTALGY
jgi:hypothetical protein